MDVGEDSIASKWWSQDLNPDWLIQSFLFPLHTKSNCLGVVSKSSRAEMSMDAIILSCLLCSPLGHILSCPMEGLLLSVFLPSECRMVMEEKRSESEAQASVFLARTPVLRMKLEVTTTHSPTSYWLKVSILHSHIQLSHQAARDAGKCNFVIFVVCPAKN